MITFYKLTHRFKRSMLEIKTDSPIEFYEDYLDPLQTEKLPGNVSFKVAAGKKPYDIIRLYQDIPEFYSQKIIDVLSQFVDMSDKCYPIRVEGTDVQYYEIYNLDAYPFLNRKDELTIDDPRYYGVQDAALSIFGIEDTYSVIVSEEVKDALMKNKVTNIELRECFGCTREEYKAIKKSKIIPAIRVFNDK